MWLSRFISCKKWTTSVGNGDKGGVCCPSVKENRGIYGNFLYLLLNIAVNLL